MANRQRFDATITIGAALQNSVKNRIGVVKAGLRGVGDEIKQVTNRQRELSKQRRVLEREGKSVDALDREYQELNQTLDRLRANQKKWQRAAAASNQVGQRFGQMTQDVGRLMRNTTLVIGGASTAIFGLANSTATLGDQTAKTSDKLGIQVEALQELRYAAERSGVESKTLDMALQRMTRRLSEAANGTGEAKGALEELGLSAEALASMTPDEALAVLADELAAVENQSDRVRLSFKLFDSEGVGLVNMLKDGSAGLQQLRADARATGYVLSEQAARDAESFKDALLDAQLGAAGLKNTIGSALMPVVTDLMGQFSGWMRENRGQAQEFAREFATGLRDALPTIGRIISGMTAMAATIGSVIGAVADLVGGFDNLGVVIGALFAGKAVLSIGLFIKSLFSLGSALAAVAGGAPAVVAGIRAIGLALMANPIGLIIGGIAAGAALIIANWDKIGPWFSALWDKIKSAAGAAWEGLKTLFSWSPLGMIIKNWGPITEWFSGLWDGIIESASAAFDWIAGKFEWLGSAIEKVKGWFDWGEDDGGGSNQQAPTPAQIERVATAQAGVRNETTNNVNQHLVFNITQQPGQDARALAEEIVRIQAEQQNAALYDTAEAY